MHKVDEGIVTGDIILQKFIEIQDNDDYKDLLLKAYKECPKLVIKALDIILKNKFNGIPQKKIKEFPIYCSRRREGDEIINWDNTSLEIFNFIRALVDLGPYAQTFIKGKRVYIKKALYFNEDPIT